MTLKVVRFCAEEVERQGDGPIEVWWMVEAWEDAQRLHPVRGPILNAMMIQRWGHLIERERNRDGCWRQGFVRVGDRRPPAPQELPTLMGRWLDNLRDMTPEEAYREFEMIHPFIDGNGRTGKVIYNWLRGTLDDPQMPPNFFGSSNP